MYKLIVQLIASVLLFCISSAVALYEGSALVNKPWEWRYSTPFSSLFRIEIQQGGDILLLDYFVYALKYQPLFPLIMVACVIYSAIIIGVILSKYKLQFSQIYFSLNGIIMLGLSVFLFDASSIGASYLFYFMGIGGIGFLILGIYSKKAKWFSKFHLNGII